MIDRYLLRYFLAVVDRGAFTKAAAQLNVAQPTLSIGIAKLERELGTKLFQRSSQRVNLTDAGARFLVHARRIESEFNLAENSVKGLEPALTFRLGVLSTVPTTMLEKLVEATRDERSERLEILPGSERELLQLLARERIEAAVTIIRPEATRFASEPLYSEGYALAMPASHALAKEAVVPGEALADNTMIVRRHCEVLSETSRHFTERGVRPFFALRTTNDDQVLSLIRAGLGITLMPDSYEADGVVRPRLAGFDMTRDIGLLYAPHAEDLRHTTTPVLTSIRTYLRAPHSWCRAGIRTWRRGAMTKIPSPCSGSISEEQP